MSRQCCKCEKFYNKDKFIQTKNFFCGDGYSAICTDCLENLLKKYGEDWNVIDRACQYLDIPFIPEKWIEVYRANKEKSFPVYNQIFFSKEYEKLNWKPYCDKFKELEKDGIIKREIPLLKEQEIASLQRKWGPNYCEEELDYLENLYNSMVLTQKMGSGLSVDQTLKLCKISLEIDNRIRDGGEIDKLLGSYEKLVKIGGFTSENAKEVSDFESVGELYAYLEKTGWVNHYYTGAKKDVIDETMANMQNYARRLWTNETGMSEDIEKRLEALKNADASIEQNTYDIVDDYDEDKYEVDGIEGLKEDFEVDI